ncbi:hypothetical protein BT96DRAFT_1023884 [Gymnopus androsaceus JB14]|uniref:Uncharacterized protein n=1 Tax=Gymnopus androsaceus JB14 TaxID=1447944 RepID=A0A6A4H0Q4_9AGAR|nr:hypothetical protein BT96DRAFT_1023884 [Gymnopus androsaceus JB14]
MADLLRVLTTPSLEGLKLSMLVTKENDHTVPSILLPKLQDLSMYGEIAGTVDLFGALTVPSLGCLDLIISGGTLSYTFPSISIPKLQDLSIYELSFSQHSEKSGVQRNAPGVGSSCLGFKRDHNSLLSELSLRHMLEEGDTVNVLNILNIITGDTSRLLGLLSYDENKPRCQTLPHLKVFYLRNTKVGSSVDHQSHTDFVSSRWWVGDSRRKSTGVDKLETFG